MKHATKATLARIEPLLKRIRNISALKEKKPGIYYFKSSAFLHFHEDGEQVFADIKFEPPNFKRLPATTSEQQDEVIRLIRDKVG